MADVQRRHIRVTGVVQGVGFRPFVYGLAHELGLAGFVLNDGDGVEIEVEGPAPTVVAFVERLPAEAPPVSSIDTYEVTELSPLGDDAFRIAKSAQTKVGTGKVGPDLALCEDCRRELLSPEDRRYRYPFINCTNCGPRFTITRQLPYDRPSTTMAGFALCPTCRAEYEDPLDRRFHAQPVACAECGPHLTFRPVVDGRMEAPEPLDDDGVVRAAASLLLQGGSLALKGLGGFHLACDATSSRAVALLRRRKRRPDKPFAIMVADLDQARAICRVPEEAADLLASVKSPIVLVDELPESTIAPEVAPRQRRLGVMIPYTPLHELLLRAVGRPLVMTSGNVTEEPIAFDDDDGIGRLRELVDGFLLHDRPIHTFCDDSVAVLVEGAPQLLRRSRGYVPEGIRLPHASPRPLTAVGGDLKNASCMVRGQDAFMGHYIGDLANVPTYEAFLSAQRHLEHVFSIEPAVVVHDLHPDYVSSRYALERRGVEHMAVQHHHAHVASVMAEHGLDTEVYGAALDGTGFGGDGTIWGGEILLASYEGFERLARLAHLGLPGGDAAVRRPSRMAISGLYAAYGDDLWSLPSSLVRRILATPSLEQEARLVVSMVAKGIRTPLTSSTGRLFDCVAALAGVADEVTYEGQAAIELEQAIDPTEPTVVPRGTAVLRDEGGLMIIDTLPLVRAVVDLDGEGAPMAELARRFHEAFVGTIVDALVALRGRHGARPVVMSGGVLQNTFVATHLTETLEAEGFDTYLNRRVPANDGGIALGQAAIAAARLARG